MKKIIAKEINPVFVDFDIISTMTIKGVGDENCTVYIVPADEEGIAALIWTNTRK